ncbi:MAG: sulfurtransferase TusA family protein [Nitrospinae bacterium]|nr:sulfurtransferase TusA family protein [Nitrospinota bacterium]
MSVIDIKTVKPAIELDVVGRVCPYPMVLTKKTTEKMKEGEVLKVLCDSAVSVTKEIPTYCEKKGYPLESIKNEEKNYWEMYIMKLV